jgi:hypothetical protein
MTEDGERKAAASEPRQLELSIDGAPQSTRVQRSDEMERARSIVSSLGELSSEEVFAAFEELDALPPEVVREALAPSTGPAPDLDRLDDATRSALGLPPRPLRLSTVSSVKDADIFDLGAVAEEQLRIAGRSWDGRDLAAEERLDEEVEGSFAGTVERRVLVDAESPSGAPLFDVLLYAGDSGAVFRSGTTELVGAIDGTTVEMAERRARQAIQEALARAPEPSPVLGPAPEPEARVEPEPPRKKAAAKKKAASAKATSTKKKASSTKKAAAETKPSAKKPSAKKATAKKATAKKKT